MVCDSPWRLSGNPPPLSPGEVHLWLATLPSSNHKFFEFERLMSSRELARADQFAFELSRTRFICARALLKQLLGLYTGSDPAKIQFQLGPQGKPYLPSAHQPALHFNSTDTGDQALFAFCLDAEVGVDIEYKTRQVNHSIIAKRKFTASELNQYFACPPLERRQFFLSIWTRKEAYGKAIGVGIRYRLSDMNLVDPNGSNRFSVQDATGVEWEVAQTEPDTDLIACVVTEGSGWRFRCHRFAAHSPSSPSAL